MPEIVLGPPGTGKTTTLLERVDAELRDGVDPRRIGYISYTRKAAQEAADRACAKFGRERADFKWFRTIHSLCFFALGCKSEDVLQGAKLNRDFAHYARTKIDSYWLEDGTLAGYTPGARALHLENLARIKMVDPVDLYDKYPEDPGVSRGEFVRVVKALRAFKQEHGYIDFTDMLEQFVREKLTVDLDVLFVDEAQDLSRLQWEVVRLLGNGPSCRRVVVAGDDDQAIYGWSGADTETLLTMPGEVEVLGQSYRVPRSVQMVADLLISKVKRRRPKTWAPRDDEGDVDRVSSIDDADLSGDDVLVLARNNFTLSELEPKLKLMGVSYKIGERLSIPSKVGAAIVHWERLRRGQSIDVQAARNVYAHMTSRKGVAHGFKTLKDWDDRDEATMTGLRQSGGLLAGDVPWYEALDAIPSGDVEYVKACLQHGEKLNRPPRVRLSTIHGAKGGEADHVVLMLEVAKKSYESSLVNPDEELRVWYVGVTRAKRKLTLVEAPTEMRCRWL